MKKLTPWNRPRGLKFNTSSNKNIIYSMIFSSLALTPMSAFSASDAKTSKEMEVLVVTATRGEMLADEAPASVTVLNAESLEGKSFNNLAEALSYEANIFEGKLRGTSSSNHTLVMLNGMPLNSGWFGGVRWDNISMENVEYIEIVRGPGSSLYGGNAMGGAINIITRPATEFESGINLRAGSNDYFTYGGYIGNKFGDNFSVRLGFEVDQELIGRPIQYVFRSVGNRDGDLTGGTASLNRYGKDYWIAVDEGDRNESQWNVNLAASYTISDTDSLRFDGQIGFNDYQNGAPNTYLVDSQGQPAYSGTIDAGDGRGANVKMSNFLNGEGEETNSSYMLTHTTELGEVSVVTKIGYQHEDKWYTSPSASGEEDYYNSDGSYRKFDTDTYFLDTQANLEINAENVLTFGAYLRKNTFDQGQFHVSDYRNGDSVDTDKDALTQGEDLYYALYVQDELTLIDDTLTAYIGARYDTWEASNGISGDVGNPISLDDAKSSAFSPSAALVWTISDQTILRTSVAKAFSGPTIYDLYRTYASGDTLNLSNPDLKAETVINYEIGIVQYFMSNNLRLSASVYQMDYNNLIYGTNILDVNDIDNNPVTVDINIDNNAGKAQIRGYEVEVSYQAGKMLDLWANYSANDSKIIENENDTSLVGKKLTSSPEYSISSGMNFTFDKYFASLNGKYTGKTWSNAANTDIISGVYQTDSEVWLWDLRVGVELGSYIGFQKLKLGLSIENLSDKEHFDYNIGQERSSYITLNAKF
ncbi:MAG: TonB-dependent receptor [Paraglaciecola sp.]|nr:TonB-dependent receptor [Paraglaciecola sp.]